VPGFLALLILPYFLYKIFSLYFNAGYIDQKTWWTLGLIISFVNIAIFLTVGFAWWKFLGLW